MWETTRFKAHFFYIGKRSIPCKESSLFLPMKYQLGKPITMESCPLSSPWWRYFRILFLKSSQLWTTVKLRCFNLIETSRSISEATGVGRPFSQRWSYPPFHDFKVEHRRNRPLFLLSCLFSRRAHSLGAFSPPLQHLAIFREPASFSLNWGRVKNFLTWRSRERIQVFPGTGFGGRRRKVSPRRQNRYRLFPPLTSKHATNESVSRIWAENKAVSNKVNAGLDFAACITLADSYPLNSESFAINIAFFERGTSVTGFLMFLWVAVVPGPLKSCYESKWFPNTFGQRLLAAKTKRVLLIVFVHFSVYPWAVSPSNEKTWTLLPILHNVSFRLFFFHKMRTPLAVPL